MIWVTRPVLVAVAVDMVVVSGFKGMDRTSDRNSVTNFTKSDLYLSCTISSRFHFL